MFTLRLLGGSRATSTPSSMMWPDGRLLEPGHESQRRRLPAARRPEEREEFTGVYLERQVVHRDDLGEPLGEAD